VLEGRFGEEKKGFLNESICSESCKTMCEEFELAEGRTLSELSLDVRTFSDLLSGSVISAEEQDGDELGPFNASLVFSLSSPTARSGSVSGSRIDSNPTEFSFEEGSQNIQVVRPHAEAAARKTGQALKRKYDSEQTSERSNSDREICDFFEDVSSYLSQRMDGADESESGADESNILRPRDCRTQSDRPYPEPTDFKPCRISAAAAHLFSSLTSRPAGGRIDIRLFTELCPKGRYVCVGGGECGGNPSCAIPPTRRRG
jgi:hypothetical protein